MPFITKYLFATVLLPPIVIWLGTRYKRKILMVSYAVLNALFASRLIVREILSFGTTETTLNQKIHFFFRNDASMIFYFVYIPLIILGTILPIIALVIQSSSKGKKNAD